MPQHDTSYLTPAERYFDSQLRRERDRLAAAYDRRIVHIPTKAEADRKADCYARFAANDQYNSLQVTTGERLVAFFRRWSGRIGVALYVLAVLVAMYFAFRLGLGR